MSGLFTKFNLSESGLDGVDAVQKLYAPRINEDITLFSYSSSLESSISNVQILGFSNQPFTSPSGQTLYRTRFITNKQTFTDDNLVWIDRVEGFSLDRRTSSEVLGAPVKFSQNGSIVSLIVEQVGELYEVVGGSAPSLVDMRVVGDSSGANNAVIRIMVNGDGTIGRDVEVLEGGSGYIFGEVVRIIPQCEEGQSKKCVSYVGPYAFQPLSVEGLPPSQLLLRNSRYLYSVKFSSPEEFSLFDEETGEWVYLGASYNGFVPLTAQVILKRLDTLTAGDIKNLANIDARSYFFSYDREFSVEGGFSNTLSAISESAENIKVSLTSFLQNCRVSDPVGSDLGISCNVVSGSNITSDYRVVFRDPDGVLDDGSVTFSQLSGLRGPDQTQLGDKNIPGLWLFTGTDYQRAFSSNTKPYISVSGKQYLSPKLSKLVGNDVVEVSESGENKYSIDAGYLKPGTTVIRGFDSQVSTLVQTISNNPNNGGFVYHRPISGTVVAPNGIESWPLFSYREGGQVKELQVLAVPATQRSLVLSNFNNSTINYLLAVEAADGQRLEDLVLAAMGTFAEYRIPLGGAAVLMAGARTLAGALVPMVGEAPTNFNFVSGDYNRMTGLVGNGSTKYLNSNYRFPQVAGGVNMHIGVRATTGLTSGRPIGVFRESVFSRHYLIGNVGGFSGWGNSTTITLPASGLVVATRLSSGAPKFYQDGSYLQDMNTDESLPSDHPCGVFVVLGSATGLSSETLLTNSLSAARLAMYTIGTGLDESQNTALNTATTAYMNALYKFFTRQEFSYTSGDSFNIGTAGAIDFGVSPPDAIHLPSGSIM